ncbi:hypothetical protein FXO38_23617 [Capsicum annuum]|nr:hypothetical protein FXO38_23617 [Capsicum annuum]
MVYCNRSSISSAGGIGGEGLYVPILTIIAGVDPRTASSFPVFMVTGGSIANVVCNMCVTSPKNGGKILIDFDIAFLSEPCMLLGVSIGVVCNKVLPEWLITILDNIEKINGMKMMRKSSESACVVLPPKLFRIMEKPVHEFRGHMGEILALSWSKNGESVKFIVEK